MRITQHILSSNALRGIRMRLEALAAAQDQSITGRRIQKVSDDPIDGSRIVRLEGDLRDVDRYRRNAVSGMTRLSAEDAVLTHLKDLIARAKATAVSGSYDDPNDPNRVRALNELQQVRDEIVALGNTRIGDEYIFGGAQTTQPPFLADGTWVGDSTVRQVEIDQSSLADTNHTGDVLFNDMIAAVDGLALQLTSGDRASITAAARALEPVDDANDLAQAQVGVRQRRIQDAIDLLGQRAGSLLDQRDKLRDADPTEAAVAVMTQQTALERAYAVVGKVLSTNLLDYLR